MPVSDEIKRAFASGATILTGNVRAARWLQREYALEQRSAGQRVWASPPIEDWDVWVRNQWQMQASGETDAPLLLTSLQERSVWTRMQREDAALLVSPASISALAESAYALLSDYEAHAERNHSWGKTDAERFRQWAAAFDRECARRNWMQRAGLELKVASGLGRDKLPSEILFVGFDRTTPAQDKLFNVLDVHGVRVEFAGDAYPDASTEFIHSPGVREEISACAWWARAQVEANPQVRVGVLVPDLRVMRSEIERIFRRVLMPQTDDIFAPQSMPFEFSLGQPLAHVPAIRSALLLLRWLDGPLREEEISWLLLSGFVSPDSSEYLALAKHDARQRDSGLLSLEIPLQDFLKRSRALKLPSLENLERAQKGAIANHIADEDRLPGSWTDLTQLLLREAGWPGAVAHDSVHFQALRRWEKALDDVALLDFDGQRMKYSDFLRMLEAHAQETIFSPESLGAPVQIMGALEASGQQFDVLWFLSADDDNLPLRGRPHPLLPNEMQRRFRMPYSDAASDLELAKAVTARISASARTVVFSHAERNRDGELRPSPLLPSNAAWRSAPLPLASIEQRELVLEAVEDASGKIAWPADRSPGGSEVLREQAACAFQAFAVERLRAKPLNRSDWGLSAAERGILLHKVLERIWSPKHGALHSLHDLQEALREGRLTGILKSAVRSVFARFDAVEDAWMRAYLSSEQHRLMLRLEEWMNEEANRIPFKVVACEQKLEGVTVGGLNLKLRADRIDEIDGFGSLLLDYKSGVVSATDWEPPRPNEPQLPLYAVFGNVEDVRGVLFARIRAGKPSFSGNVTDVRAQLFRDVQPNSALAKDPYNEAMRDAWHDALLNLAEDFLRGEAAVDPKERKKTCRYCALPGLCRVAEVRDPLEEEDDAEVNDNGE
jgi:ATP-dependent helicase/nuclease subunit B